MDEVPDDNIALWNSMIHGYVKCGHNQEALGLFNQIRSRKLRPDEATMVGLILACRNLGDLSHGIDLHYYVESSSKIVQIPVVFCSIKHKMWQGQTS
ncbi:hypothetical protein GBA52_017592 [Prunus armeniaca]|nr:hypothetical protein GBA52_017592 [Prunus armeniaca]